MPVHRLVRLLLACAALLVAAGARAQAVAPPVRFVVGMGFDRGSAELLEVGISDGSTQTLRANEGLYFEGGVSVVTHRTARLAVDTVATVGVKGWNVGAGGDMVNYLAFPLELLERVSFEQARVGVGLSFLLAPRFSSSGALSGNDADLRNSLGIVIQTDWIGRRAPGGGGVFLGGRFVWQKLEGEHGTNAVDANAFGIRLGLEL